MKTATKYYLTSGNSYELIKIHGSLIPNYFLLAFPKNQGQPNSSEVSEMLKLGVEHAKKESLLLLGTEEAYSIIYSGYSARREKGWHVHIILLGNRWKKTWLYTVLAFKNLLQAFNFRKDDSPKI